MVLQLKYAPQADGFLLSSRHARPLTWDLRGRIPGEMAHVSTLLTRQGITPQVGMEMEFSFSRTPPSDDTPWLAVKQKMLSDLQLQIASAADNQTKSTLVRRLEQAAAFGPEEVLMYDLLYLDPRTCDLATRSFGGKDIRQGGFFDSEGTFELQLMHTDPASCCHHRKEMTRVLFEKARDYGLSFSREPSHHISFSFLKDGKNLFDADHPEFLTRGKSMLEGMARVAHDLYPCMVNAHKVQPYPLPHTSLLPERLTFLRMANGRVEFRPAMPAEMQNPDFIALMGLIGAQYGVAPKDAEYFQQQVIHADLVEKPFCAESDASSHKILRHVINGSYLKDGEIVWPKAYIDNSTAKIGEELGIISRDEREAYDRCLARGGIPFRFPLKDWFAQIRIDATGIHWPVETNHIYGGGYVDMVRLRQGVKLGGIVPQFVISPGYVNRSMREAVEIARQSKPMEEVCRSDFLEAFRQSMVNVFYAAPFRSGYVQR